jgi:hypothetical protein
MSNLIPIEQINDIFGNVRKLGSLTPPANFVSSFQTFEDAYFVWEDSEIRRAILDPKRLNTRTVFDKYWLMNQFNFGSCNGFAAAAALAKARWLRGIRDKLKLSGAFIYSLINGNRDNGSALEDGLKAIQEFGACPESLVTYDMIYKHQQPKNAVMEAAKHRGLACFPCKTKQGFRTAVAAQFPVIVAVHAGRGYQTTNSKGKSGVDNGRGNHAVHVDNAVIIDGEEVYDHAGSWGPSLGDEGRTYLGWESFEQTFQHHMFYAIASTQEIE